ncbi:MAG: His/Gly/Thr/Pro-type tRNA ligase C-terminal domain-containing protein, partial [Clostridia bacterium]
PGWKYAEYEMKGVPVRLEIGPRDIENNQCVLVRRDTREKTIVSLDNLEEEIANLLSNISDNLYKKALNRREEMTYTATTLEEITEIAATKPGFIKAMWCGDVACENKLKEVSEISSRCIPFEEQQISSTCVCCGKPAKHMLYWGKAY